MSTEMEAKLAALTKERNHWKALAKSQHETNVSLHKTIEQQYQITVHLLDPEFLKSVKFPLEPGRIEPMKEPEGVFRMVIAVFGKACSEAKDIWINEPAESAVHEAIDYIEACFTTEIKKALLTGREPARKGEGQYG